MKSEGDEADMQPQGTRVKIGCARRSRGGAGALHVDCPVTEGSFSNAITLIYLSLNFDQLIFTRPIKWDQGQSAPATDPRPHNPATHRCRPRPEGSFPLAPPHRFNMSHFHFYRSIFYSRVCITLFSLGFPAPSNIT
jgi:hypothetical protein